jgi:hypothetical protein
MSGYSASLRYLTPKISKQFARDWSKDGEEERNTSYAPLKDALLAHFVGVPVEERGKKRVLVPGVGLGRLAFDVASLGQWNSAPDALCLAEDKQASRVRGTSSLIICYWHPISS